MQTLEFSYYLYVFTMYYNIDLKKKELIFLKAFNRPPYQTCMHSTPLRFHCLSKIFWSSKEKRERKFVCFVSLLSAVGSIVHILSFYTEQNGLKLAFFLPLKITHEMWHWLVSIVVHFRLILLYTDNISWLYYKWSALSSPPYPVFWRC